jgi:hypothetical protein
MPHSDLFPRCEETLNGLINSIAQDGVLDSVKIWKGHDVVIDGHSRLTVAHSLGIPLAKIPFMEIEAPTLDKAMETGVTINVTRRALDREQMTALCITLRKEYEWSIRRIALVLVMAKSTVQRYLGESDDPDLPQRIVGIDGKSRPATAPAKAEPEQTEASTVPSGTVEADATSNSDPDDPDIAKLEGEWGGDKEEVPEASEKETNLKNALLSLGRLTRAIDNLGLMTPQAMSSLQYLKTLIEQHRKAA